MCVVLTACIFVILVLCLLVYCLENTQFQESPVSWKEREMRPTVRQQVASEAGSRIGVLYNGSCLLLTNLLLHLILLFCIFATVTWFPLSTMQCFREYCSVLGNKMFGACSCGC